MKYFLITFRRMCHYHFDYIVLYAQNVLYSFLSGKVSVVESVYLDYFVGYLETSAFSWTIVLYIADEYAYFVAASQSDTDAIL